MISSRKDVERHIESPHSVAIDAIDECAALLKHHFVLLSRVHSEYFLRFSHIGRSPVWLSRVADVLARDLPAVDHVLAPETAGMFLADAISTRLNATLIVVGVDAHRRPTSNVVTAAVPAGTTALIVNDMVSTGNALTQMKEIAENDLRLDVAGAATFVAHKDAATDASRGNLRLHYLATAHWPVYSQADCPLCYAGLPWVWSGELN